MEGRRIVIAGPSGSGKSASGNTIFGRNVFISAAGSCNVTQTCTSVDEEVEDTGKFLVVDTPSPLTQNQGMKCLSLCAPGPHVFLLTVRVGRFTEEVEKEVESLRKVFGEAMFDHTIVLFTYRDNIEETGENLQDHLEDANPCLRILLDKCGQRHHIFDNKNQGDRKQVKELVEKIEEMVKDNHKKHYERVTAPSVKIISVCTLFSFGALLRFLWQYWTDEDNIRPVLFFGTAVGAGIIWLLIKTLKH